MYHVWSVRNVLTVSATKSMGLFSGLIPKHLDIEWPPSTHTCMKASWAFEIQRTQHMFSHGVMVKCQRSQLPFLLKSCRMVENLSMKF